MPPTPDQEHILSLQEVADRVGLYPIDAFEFVQAGLTYTVGKIHSALPPDSDESRHVSGQQLCGGLRELALERWGLMARAVLRRWNITSTFDFGRIVFSLVESGRLRTTEQDDIEDFRNVYDFKAAFDHGYRIASKV